MSSLLFLSRRWLRGRGALRASVILALTFVVLGAVFVCVSAFTPTPRQSADAAFGSYAQQTYTGVYVGDLHPGSLASIDSAVSEAVPGSHLVLESGALRPDSFARTYVQAPLATVRYVEDPGLREAFPGRYTLVSGLWPTAPFDVVVSQHMRSALPAGTSFTVLSGRATLHVVGVVTDAFARHDDLVIGGPGTFERIPRPAPGHEYQPVDATLAVLFGARTPVADVARALRASLPPVPQVRATTLATLRGNLTTRAEVASTPATTFGSQGQLVVSYLPLLLVVLLVSSLVVGQLRTPQHATADRLVALGVRRGRVRLAQAVTVALLVATSVVTGLALGWLLAVVLRDLVLDRLADQTLSPVPGPDPAALGIAAGALVLVLAGTLWPVRAAGTRASTGLTARVWRRLPLGMIRRAAVVVLAVAALHVGGGFTSVVSSYLAVAAVLLASPDVLRLVVRALPHRSPRAFVARRLMTADVGRQATAVVVVGCCLALPICAGTQLTSRKASDASFSYSHVPVGQIWVADDGGSGGGDIAGVARAVSAVPGIGPAVVLRDVNYRGPRSSGAAFSQPSSGSSSGYVAVVDSADQVARVLGRRMPADAAAVLDSGGVLDFTHARGPQRFVVSSAAGRRLLVTPVLRTLKVSLTRQLRASFGGAVLLSTARRLGLPVKPPSKFVFTGASPTLTADAAAAAVAAGYDTAFVQYAVRPPPPTLPTDAYVFLAGLVLGGFAVLLAVIRGQARQLRGYSSRLVAIGVGPRWTLSVLGIQAAVVIGVGLLAGVAAGLLGVRVTAERYAATAVPVLPIALACASTLVAAGLATALAVRALTATEDPEVT